MHNEIQGSCAKSLLILICMVGDADNFTSLEARNSLSLFFIRLITFLSYINFRFFFFLFIVFFSTELFLWPLCTKLNAQHLVCVINKVYHYNYVVSTQHLQCYCRVIIDYQSIIRAKYKVIRAKYFSVNLSLNVTHKQYVSCKVAINDGFRAKWDYVCVHAWAHLVFMITVHLFSIIYKTICP